ncbi:hypothetical protein M758_UG297400 [Ceratodon purpureus]|nr:hypothetical protein M758_UG297400 [Ceratodon purpureus]
MLKSTRPDIPTAYHRSVGDHRFDGPWYTLDGPTQSVLVKSARYFSQKQTFCHLTKGWVDFVAVNQLKMGDHLLFIEVGEARFEVVKI